MFHLVWQTGNQSKGLQMILIGTKIDSREARRDIGRKVVDTQQGVAAASAIGEACKYFVETSSQNDRGVAELMDILCKIGISNTYDGFVPQYGKGEIEIEHKKKKQGKTSLITSLAGRPKVGLNEKPHLKVVIVGDAAIGKSALVARLTNHKIDWEAAYEPTKFDNFEETWKHEGEEVDIELWDTAGKQNSTLRRLAYPGADILLVAYDVGSEMSLSHVTQLWVPELYDICGREQMDVNPPQVMHPHPPHLLPPPPLPLLSPRATSVSPMSPA